MKWTGWTEFKVIPADQDEDKNRKPPTIEQSPPPPSAVVTDDKVENTMDTDGDNRRSAKRKPEEMKGTDEQAQVPRVSRR